MTFNPDPAAALRSLSALPGFAATPLRTLAQPAGPTILIKDERDRMGLGAFKAVGGIHAVATLMAERGGVPTFVCASAGNHGYAVATGARLLGAKARIHLSRSTPAPFVARLQLAGAEVVISDARYDELLLEAQADAAATGAILLSDTADTLDARRPWSWRATRSSPRSCGRCSRSRAAGRRRSICRPASAAWPPPWPT